MISMFAWGCGGKPVLGAISSSFQMRNEPQPVRAGSSWSAKEKWCLALSQPRSSPASLLNGRRSIIGTLPGSSGCVPLSNLWTSPPLRNRNLGNTSFLNLASWPGCPISKGGERWSRSSGIFALPTIFVPLRRGHLITSPNRACRPSAAGRSFSGSGEIVQLRRRAVLRRGDRTTGPRDAPDGTAFDVLDRGGSLERGGSWERHLAGRETGPVSRHQGRCAATSWADRSAASAGNSVPPSGQAAGANQGTRRLRQDLACRHLV